MLTPATVIPTCPTCGLPAQADVVQAFRDLRAHVDLLDKQLAKADAESTNWRRLTETLADMIPLDDPQSFRDRIAQAKANHPMEPIHA